MTGELSDDAFLASLYDQDNAIELENYSPEFSSHEEAQNYAEIIHNMPFQQFCERVLQHSKLMRDFLHFRIIRFETFEESEKPNLCDVPFLLTKRANMNRYIKGELLPVVNKQNYFLNVV